MKFTLKKSSTEQETAVYTFGHKDYLLLRSMRAIIVVILLMACGAIGWFINQHVFQTIEQSSDIILLRQTPDVGTLNFNLLEKVTTKYEQRVVSVSPTTTIQNPFTNERGDDSVPTLSTEASDTTEPSALESSL